MNQLGSSVCHSVADGQYPTEDFASPFGHELCVAFGHPEEIDRTNPTSLLVWPWAYFKMSKFIV